MNLDIYKVRDTVGMSGGCESLTTLDLSSFDTFNVTSMHEMFYNCKSLKSLDISNFNIIRVFGINDMFSGCESLINLITEDEEIKDEFKRNRSDVREIK